MLVGQGKRCRLAAAVVLLAAGCSGTTPSQPEAPPPPATRALVTWADTLCSATEALDKLRADAATAVQRSGIDAEFYVQRTAGSVESTTKTLKELEPAQLAEADAYVAGLLKTLGDLQLPPSDDPVARTAPDDQKLAQAKQVAASASTLGKPKADLTDLVRKTPGLVSSYQLAPACAGPADLPQRVLVVWSDKMCVGTKEVEGLRVGEPISDDPRFAQFAGMELAHAIDEASTRVDSVSQPLAILAPTGIPEADAFKAELLTALDTAKGKLPKTTMMTGHDLPIGELKSQVAQAGEVLNSVKPKAQGLPALAGRLPRLTASYDLAPHCTPLNGPAPTSKPLPAASNGTDLKACESGKCQVQISGTVELTVGGHKFKVVVSDQGVVVSDDISLIQLGKGGGGSSGRDGRTVNFHVAGFSPSGAVLDISTTA